jgi:hypothetical protein
VFVILSEAKDLFPLFAGGQILHPPAGGFRMTVMAEGGMDGLYEDPKAEYLMSPEPGVSVKALAEKWGIPAWRLTRRCAREGWVEQRRRVQAGKATNGGAEPADIMETPQSISSRHRRWWHDVGKAAHKCIRHRKQAERFDDVRTLEMIGRTMKIATDGERTAAGMGSEDEDEPRRVAIEWLFPAAKEGDGQ